MMTIKKIILFIFFLPFVYSCDSNVKDTKEDAAEVAFIQPDWSKDAVIYEVNIRQYSEEGTLNEFNEHLPRLKDLGVDILWLMPINPIGELNRKGAMGSYYSVKDYTVVNPEFGTMEDFKLLVNEAHEMGMFIILDWVANHSAWDNPWAENHPDWYKRNEDGEFLSPYDWTDVIALNYENIEMRQAMIEAMKFWVSEANIDGYRCDVAGEVPLDFWEAAREELDKVKPVFMLAEAEEADHLNKAFNMNYSWRLHFEVNEIVQGVKPLEDLYKYFIWNKETFPAYGYRMNFIDNHDENSWKGTINSRLGDAQKMAATFMWTIPGMPLMYSGQEVGLDKSLEFFEKDLIDWDKDTNLTDFYKSLNEMKKLNKALWNGLFGGEMSIVSGEENEEVFAFTRTLQENTVLAIFNFTDKNVSWRPVDETLYNSYTDQFNDEIIEVNKSTKIDLEPFGYSVLVINK